MKEVTKVQILLGIFSLLLLFYETFENLPELFDIAIKQKIETFKLLLFTVLRIGFYASISVWSFASVLTVQKEK